MGIKKFQNLPCENPLAKHLYRESLNRNYSLIKIFRAIGGLHQLLLRDPGRPKLSARVRDRRQDSLGHKTL